MLGPLHTCYESLVFVCLFFFVVVLLCFSVRLLTEGMGVSPTILPAHGTLSFSWVALSVLI